MPYHTSNMRSNMGAQSGASNGRTKRIFLLAEKALGLDITAIIQDLRPRRDIGLVKHGDTWVLWMKLMKH